MALPYVPPSTGAVLWASCIFWYDFGPSDVFLDAKGNNNLSQVGGTSAPCTTLGDQFVGNTFFNEFPSGPNWMGRASKVGMGSINTTGFTLVSWSKHQMVNGILGVWEDPHASFAMHGDTDGSGYRGRLYVSPDGTGASSVNVITGYVNNSADANVWHFHAGWFDPGASKIHGQMDNGTVNETAFSGLWVGSSTMTVGGLLESGSGLVANKVDSMAMFNRPLTADERTWLYNGGAGRHSSELLV